MKVINIDELLEDYLEIRVGSDVFKVSDIPLCIFEKGLCLAGELERLIKDTSGSKEVTKQVDTVMRATLALFLNVDQKDPRLERIGIRGSKYIINEVIEWMSKVGDSQEGSKDEGKGAVV